MVFIEGGIFRMGEGGFAADLHDVFLSPFYINKYPVTQAEWQAVMGNNPSFFKGDNLPMEQVSWEDVQVFIKKLNEQTGEHYCLPSDAQWVFAAKGGQNFKYAGSDNPEEVGWSAENSGDNKLLEYWNLEKMTANNCRTHPVGQKKANGYGLYDMSGNVCEWCQDVYSSAFYAECRAQGLVKNPVYMGGGTKRVFRGGSWRLPVVYSAYLPRFEVPPMNKYNHLGFRLCKIA
jgi:formylglycine-generating enzyme required for sulfatase activity